MPESPPERVYAPLLLHFPELVTECGAVPEPLLRQAGIGQKPAEIEQATYRQVAQLLEITAASLGRPDFGMMLATRQCRDGIEGPLGRVMRHARCFGDVLELAVDHSYAHSLASNSWIRRTCPGGPVLLGHDILLDDLPSTCQVIEQILLVGHLIAMRLTGGAVRARRVLFRHRRTSSPEVYRRYFGCEVRFDEAINATAYSERDLACPILSADPSTFRDGLAAVTETFPEKQLPFNRIVRGAILPVLCGSDCTCGHIADRLCLHVRTLHRRLRQEGTSFRRILDEVRRDLARYYLCNTDLDIKSISERLGFSEQSAFARRSRKWFDGPPSQVRSVR